MAEKPLSDWNSHLFDCFEDASTCCYGFWCGPCLACTVSGRFGENYCLPICDILCTAFVVVFCGIPVLVPPAALSLRSSMRHKHGIKGSSLKDILATCFCSWCSWCQMHRELKDRKKTPAVINVQSQNVINMQPAPMMMMMMPASLPSAGFVNQPDVTTSHDPSNPAVSFHEHETKNCDL